MFEAETQALLHVAVCLLPFTPAQARSFGKPTAFLPGYVGKFYLKPFARISTDNLCFYELITLISLTTRKAEPRL